MSSALIEQQIEQHGWPVVDELTLPDFLLSHERSVLFFTEDPKQFPESLDVAVILPELAARFAGRFAVAVVDRSAEHALHRRYPFSGWPALVFMRGTGYVGAISRVQEWSFFVTETARLLESAPLHQGVKAIPVPVALGV